MKWILILAFALCPMAFAESAEQPDFSHLKYSYDGGQDVCARQAIHDVAIQHMGQYFKVKYLGVMKDSVNSDPLAHTLSVIFEFSDSCGMTLSFETMLSPDGKKCYLRAVQNNDAIADGMDCG